METHQQIEKLIIEHETPEQRCRPTTNGQVVHVTTRNWLTDQKQKNYEQTTLPNK